MDQCHSAIDHLNERLGGVKHSLGQPCLLIENSESGCQLQTAKDFLFPQWSLSKNDPIEYLLQTSKMFGRQSSLVRIKNSSIT